MKRLTLSFDNGPSPDVTPLVLDILAQHGLKATFFVCGKDVQNDAQRALLLRARSEGHRIGNHTFTHTVQLGRTADPTAPEKEIGRTQEVLGELADEDRLFRPYGGGGVLGPGLLSLRAVRFLCAGGYTCVLWNSVPRDWEDTRHWPERALQDIRRQDWTLVVLHDIPSGAMKELPRFLKLVQQAGVAIVQEFPPECVPLLRGEVVGSLDSLVSDAEPDHAF
jgi:peptidoglycan/xylan/chitin deacetylase (PgdA/CDA1 family)